MAREKREVRRRAEEIGSPVNKKKFGVYTKQCRGSATELHEGNSTIESISIRHEKKTELYSLYEKVSRLPRSFLFFKTGGDSAVKEIFCVHLFDHKWHKI